MGYRKVPEMHPDERAATKTELRQSARQLKLSKIAHAELIRDALERGMTTGEVAEVLGIGSTTVGRWARGAA